MKKVLLIIIILGVIFGIFYFLDKKEAIAPVVVPPVVITPVVNESKKVELCFAKFGTPDLDGNYDKYTLRLMLNGEKTKGELNFLPKEKDTKTGEFEGTVGAVDKVMMARTADLWWFTFGEGMNVKEQLKIIFGEGTARIGFGEMVDRGDGVYIYKNPEKISYTLNLTDVACADLVERANVENYLRDNIGTLSLVKPVLGGTWYVVSLTIDLVKNLGTVVYEDGHIQEKKDFSYTINEKQEVLSLTIK
ncbi:MAG: hypothetical protein WC884_00315 [Candidatus Paceibacterota bacterium]